MIQYPKIKTLFNRGTDKKVIPTSVRCEEFLIPKEWLVTEKIDGTNIRIGLTKDGQRLIGGRTDNANIPTALFQKLDQLFPVEKLKGVFQQDPTTGCYPEVTLFGEGYGPKIQNGGYYSSEPQFILFDAIVENWWLNWDSLEAVAIPLGIKSVPKLGVCDLDEAISLLNNFKVSKIAKDQHLPEGIVCRTDPLLFTRKGERVMWKLKHRDF